MLRLHCGQVVVPISDNPKYFRKRCEVCGQVFKQRKRQPETADGKPRYRRTSK